jgi:WD40 repeat protein
MRWVAFGACVAAISSWGCGTNLTAPVDAAGGRGIGGSGAHAGTPRETEDAAWDSSGSDGGAVGPTVKADAAVAGGTARRDAGATGGTGGAAGQGTPGRAGAGGGVPSGDRAADGGVVCPSTAAPGDAGVIDSGAPIARPPTSWGAPTPVPFSCTPLPSTFFFPRPGTEVPGVYARCASFLGSGTTALAVSSDGTRVVLIEADGLARIVDVASHMVVGVLAPPRESINTAAFSPDGTTILTFAKGELVVTTWRADTFAPIWSTTLPGQTYDDAQTAATAFSPDGTTVLVSPGADLFLLDAATGAIRATRSSGQGNVVLAAGYGLGGQRIAVEESSLTGAGTTCGVHPTGGTVTILDPTNLTPIAAPMNLTPAGKMPFFEPGQLLIATDGDLMLIGQYVESVPAAFRISDGGALPAPGLTDVPLLVTPDGTAALVASSGTLQLQRVTDGSVVTSVAAAPTTVAISADGSTIATGAAGLALLSVWRPSMGLFAQTCFADPQQTGATKLSPDGQTIAVSAGSQLRMQRRTDGALLSTIGLGPDYATESVQLSPDGAHAIVSFYDQNPIGSEPTFPLELFPVSGNAPPIDLLEEAPAGSAWAATFAFQPDGQTMLGLLMPKGTGGGTIVSIQLSTGAISPELTFHSDVSLDGVSAGCPIVSSFAAFSESAWRACGACNGPAFAPGTSGGIVSLDGRVYLSEQPSEADLWQILPSPSLIRRYPARPEAATWGLSECPVAVSGSADAVITDACAHAPCTTAPGFTSRVHDVATDQIIDELPPGITSASGDLSVVALGSVLWCVR